MEASVMIYGKDVCENTMGSNDLNTWRTVPPNTNRTNQACRLIVALEVNHDRGHKTCLVQRSKMQ